eukprot:45081-Rhodomonas_salina.2
MRSYSRAARLASSSTSAQTEPACARARTVGWASCLRAAEASQPTSMHTSSATADSKPSGSRSYDARSRFLKWRVTITASLLTSNVTMSNDHEIVPCWALPARSRTLSK